MRSRWYDPQAGRFVSEDPIGIEGGSNLYAFAGNDPVNNLDPSGTCYYRQGYYHPSDGSWSQEQNVYVRPGGAKYFQNEGLLFCGCDDQTWQSSQPYCPEHNSSPSAPGGKDAGAWPGRDVSASRLASCTADQLGVKDLLAGGAVALGAPLVKKPFVIPGSSGATTVASKFLSAEFPQKLPFRVWAPTAARPLARSNVVGRIAGRWLPWLGWALLAHDAYEIGGCTLEEHHGAGGSF